LFSIVEVHSSGVSSLFKNEYYGGLKASAMLYSTDIPAIPTNISSRTNEPWVVCRIWPT